MIWRFNNWLCRKEDDQKEGEEPSHTTKTIPRARIALLCQVKICLANIRFYLKLPGKMCLHFISFKCTQITFWKIRMICGYSRLVSSGCCVCVCVFIVKFRKLPKHDFFNDFGSNWNTISSFYCFYSYFFSSAISMLSWIYVLCSPFLSFSFYFLFLCILGEFLKLGLYILAMYIVYRPLGSISPGAC